ncbi:MULTISPECIES: permease [Psychromonas]|uniref:permease n=1 Tax=Psychromonas TaxID=67572 RepID=UPI0004290736|nr:MULTISPECIES: permease [Psychromonas]MBB1273855.1 permease [Psychromonas sp. SR45-3]
MLVWFTYLANYITYDLLGLVKETPLANGLHFFIEDTSKILVLLLVLIYFIAIIRAALNPEKVRYYLQGKHRFIGYLLGSFFGSVTPFCSCSSIPLFMGFVSARIPLGVTIAFLLTSPLINEVVVVMLGSLLGLKFTIIYIAIGISLGIFAGFLIDVIKAERWLVPFLAKQYQSEQQVNPVQYTAHKMSLLARHQFAKEETLNIFKRVWKWVIIGVAIGALIHGVIPAQWFSDHLGAKQWWSVPLATVLAIPMYINATAIVPVLESLLLKGVPLGTTLAFCMSAVAVSLPEFMMLKQVMSKRLLFIIAAYLLVALSLLGWLFNAINL